VSLEAGAPPVASAERQHDYGGVRKIAGDAAIERKPP
jgi:hypothetical protein